MTKSPALLSTFLAFALFAPLVMKAHAAALTADQILKKVEQHMQSKDDSAHVKMTIIEADGAKKERDLEIIRRSTPDGQSVLVRLKSPADLRGTGLLSVNKGSQSDQWLYLPSSKQTRRILSSKRSSNFLDSELSYEDMGGTGGTKVTSTIAKTENSPQGPVTVIESKIDNPDSAYSKILTWVSGKNYLVTKLEYYDRANALMKTTEMSDYKAFKNNIWRAQKVYVKNLQKNRATELDLVDLKVDQGLKEKDFSPSALESP